MTDTLLAVFTGVLAFAVVMQSVFLFLMFRGIRRVSSDVLPQIQKLTEKTEEALTAINDIAETIRPVTRNLADSTAIVHNRVVEIDGFLEEIMEKSRREIIVIEDTLHDVTRRLRDAVYMLIDGVVLPVSRINALARGISAAAGVLFRRRGKEKSGKPASTSAVSDNNTIHF